ncbi:MAG: delta-60 repeat domain-containing protein, partial [Saprospiraceae bacterium]
MKTIFLLCCLLQSLIGFTQAGVLDQTFSGDGKVITAVGTGNDHAYGVASQPNGKLVVVGSSENGASTDFAIVRYNSDGSLDNSFSGDGKLILDIAGGNDEARAVVILSNGMILISGFASVGNSTDFAIVLLSADGKLVNSFSGDGKATIDFSGTDDFCYSMLVNNDKIYLVGST